MISTRSLISAGAVLMFVAGPPVGARQPAATPPPGPATLTVPEGFTVSVFAAGLTGGRLMAVSPEGTIVLARRAEVVALSDVDKDGRAEPSVLLTGQGYAHSVAFKDGYLYVGTTAAVKRVRWANGAMAGELETFAELPASTPSLHSSRSIAFGPDGRLYVGAGSSCNVCVESDARRTSIQVLDAKGLARPFATGLRNPVGFDWDPRTGRMWAADIAQDSLGDDEPPEEINLIEEGRHYGFPFFYGPSVPSTVAELKDAPRTMSARDVVAPRLELPAHTTPLGITFYRGTRFAEPYRSSLYVAMHGSTTRSTKVGYAVARVVMENGQPVRHEPFVTGWLNGDVVTGRPAGVITGSDGALYVSDDRAGYVYRVTAR
ncbi:MAG TPA: PQQ-dependent sugar dehydrogenase [Vicinamibacterales bacterium]|nr:PQQ-dependent sugar dehydrogenase [Vicinamibacterales bacterium]